MWHGEYGGHGLSTQSSVCQDLIRSYGVAIVGLTEIDTESPAIVHYLSRLRVDFGKMECERLHEGNRKMSRVENRRSSFSLPVATDESFRDVASVRFGIALFPVPAHRTGQADFPHPALGKDTPWSV